MADAAKSCPAEDGWTSALFPEYIKTKEVPCGCGYLEDDLPGGPHDFGCHIDHLAAQGRWVRFQRNNARTHILLEALVDEEGHKQSEVESGIGGKSFEGQHLRAEVFESPVDEFIAPPAMSLADDRLDMEKVSIPGIPQLLINSVAHAQIGVENAHRSDELKQHLGCAKGV